MYLAVKTLMQEHGIPLYQVTETDQQVLDNWHLTHPDLDTDVGRIANLIRRVFTFDYYYNYSDDGGVYRRWSKAEEEITEELRLLPDRQYADLISSFRSGDKVEGMVKSFPWLENLTSYSLYANLLHDSYDHDDIVVLIGVSDWIRTLMRRTRLADLAGYVQYASDVQKATQLLRHGEKFDAHGDAPLKGITVPNEWLKDLAVLGKILETRGMFTPLRKDILKYAINIQYVQGFTIYSLDNFYIMI